jgi:hypothetical protein
MKKPRVQSPLDILPLHQKQALMAWLTTGGDRCVGITYAAARKRLAADFSVKTSETALSYFYHRHNPVGAPAENPGVAITPTEGGFTVTINVRLLPCQ